MLFRSGVGGKEPAPPPDIPPAAPEGQGGPAPEVHIYPTGAARQKAAARRKAGGAEPAESPRQSAKPARSPASGKGASAAARRPAGQGKAGARGRRTRKREPAGSRAALIAAAAALLIGLAVRAAGMGLLPFL